jgi:hypothetical protein
MGNSGWTQPPMEIIVVQKTMSLSIQLIYIKNQSKILWRSNDQEMRFKI